MIGNVVLNTSETSIYQAASGKSFAMLSLMFCNTSLVDQNLSVYVYPNGGSATNGNVIIKDLTIGPKDTFVWDCNEKIILSSLDKISAITTGSITVTYNGMEI